MDCKDANVLHEAGIGPLRFPSLSATAARFVKDESHAGMVPDNNWAFERRHVSLVRVDQVVGMDPWSLIVMLLLVTSKCFKFVKELYVAGRVPVK